MAVLCVASVLALAGPKDLGADELGELVQGFVLGAGSMIDETFCCALANPSGLFLLAVADDGAKGLGDLEYGRVVLLQVGHATPFGSFSFDSTSPAPPC